VPHSVQLAAPAQVRCGSKAMMRFARHCKIARQVIAQLRDIARYGSDSLLPLTLTLSPLKGGERG
jgi:hypothetical protein